MITNIRMEIFEALLEEADSCCSSLTEDTASVTGTVVDLGDTEAGAENSLMAQLSNLDLGIKSFSLPSIQVTVDTSSSITNILYPPLSPWPPCCPPPPRPPTPTGWRPPASSTTPSRLSRLTTGGGLYSVHLDIIYVIFEQDEGGHRDGEAAEARGVSARVPEPGAEDAAGAGEGGVP